MNAPVHLQSQRRALDRPTKRRWTIDEMVELAREGYIEGKAELWDGEIIELPPMGLLHASVIQNLARHLYPRIPDSFWLSFQSIHRFDASWAPEPDFALLDRTPDDPVAPYPTPQLVIEVMDSSRDRDLNEKKLRYAQHEVPEYWVADLTRRVMHVFREPVAHAQTPESAWRFMDIVRPGGTVTPLCLPELTVDVAAVLPDAK